MTFTAQQVIEILESYKFTYNTEVELQNAIERVFKDKEIAFQRECRLGDDLRIDFMVSEGIGIEIKIKGSPSDVARQLLNYANRPEIKCLILVTGRMALSRLPAELLGKKLYVFPLWRSFL